MSDLPFMAVGALFPLAHGGAHGFELPPLHPIFVNFTAALLPASLVSDVLGRWLRRESLTAAGFWTLLYAAVITPLTAAAGWLWLRQMGPMRHDEMAIHQWLGTTLALAVPALAYWRSRVHREGRTPGTAYLAAAALLVAAVVVQGGLGGKMSFGGHGAPAKGEEAPPGDYVDPGLTPTDGASRVKEDLGHYYPIRIALAADKTDAVKEHAQALAKSKSEPVANASKALAAAADLAAARKAFGDVSKALIADVQVAANEKRDVGTVYLFECPMAKPFGQWVQPDEDMGNPYYGSEMLKCGKKVSVLAAPGDKRAGEPAEHDHGSHNH